MTASPPRPLLIYFHIPKNAGTTLGRMIKLKLGFWPPARLLHHTVTLGYYHVPEAGPRMDAIRRLSQRDQQRVRFFEGHVGFGVHKFLPQPNTYITMLRDPIDRALSVYYALRQHRLLPEDTTLETFLRHGDPQRVWWIDNAQVRYLAGDDGHIVNTPQGTCPPDLLEVAKRRLDEHFLFVGITERFDASVILLRRILGWRSCYYATSNVTRERRSKEEMPPPTLDLLREYNTLDLALYDHARARFEDRLREEGPSFQAELERFEVRNRRYNNTIGRAYSVLPAGRRLLSRLKIIRGATDQAADGLSGTEASPDRNRPD
ncbi:MAG: sulfotransferase family 2 domain-containing protein [Planctomycetota bacterium]|jgi:hypothetical protein